MHAQSIPHPDRPPLPRNCDSLSPEMQQNMRALCGQLNRILGEPRGEHCEWSWGTSGSLSLHLRNEDVMAMFETPFSRGGTIVFTQIRDPRDAALLAEFCAREIERPSY